MTRSHLGAEAMTAPNDVAALVERARANVDRVNEESADMYDAWIAERGGTTSRAHWKARAIEAEAKVAALQAEVERAKEDERDRLLQEAVGRQVGPQGWRDIAAFLKAQGARGPSARSASRKENTP